MQFENRSQAGKFLARGLRAYANRNDVIVVALPRGGVPVAFEVAQALNAPLDIISVRKLGVPGEPELAMGAIAKGNVYALNEELIQSLCVSKEQLDKVIAIENRELERRDFLYHSDCPTLQVEGCTVLLVDDGIATGTTMRAAIASLRQQRPAAVIVAVPVASYETWLELKQIADRLFCPLMPRLFTSVGEWYRNFEQVGDEEVCSLLAEATQRTLQQQKTQPLAK